MIRRTYRVNTRTMGKSEKTQGMERARVDAEA